MAGGTRRDFLGGMAAAGAALALPGAAAAPVLAGEPPLPAGAFRQFGSVRFRTAESVTWLEFSPDGRFLLAGTARDEWLVWDAASGDLAATIPIDQPRSRAVGTTARNELVLFTEAGGVPGLTVHALATGKETARRYWPPHGLGDGATFQFVPNARLLLAHAADRTFAIDVATGRARWQAGIAAPVFVSADGRRAVAVSGNGLVALDAASGAPAGRIRLDDAFRPAAVSADGRRVMATRQAGQNVVLGVWDFAGGDELWRETLGSGPYSGFAFAPDGKRILFATGDLRGPYSWRLLDATTGDRVLALPGRHACAAYAPDGKTIAVVAAGRITFLDAATGRCAPRNPDPHGEWADPVFLTDGRVAVADRPADDRTPCWRVFDPAGADPRAVPWPDDGSRFNSGVALRPDGKEFLYHGPRGLEVFDAATGKTVATVLLRDEARQLVPSQCHWLNGGRAVATATSAGMRVNPVRTRGGDTIPSPNLLGGVERMHAFLVSGDGRVPVALHSHEPWGNEGPSFRVIVYDLVASSARALKRCRGYTTLVDLSGDGRTALASCPPGERLCRHYALDLRRDRETELYFEGEAAALTPDGRAVVARLYDDEHGWRFGLFEVASQSFRWVSPAVGRVRAVAVSPDGRTILTQHPVTPLLLWDVYGERTDRRPKPDAATLKRLADPSGEAAFPAVRQLVQHPAEAVALLHGFLKPVAPLTRADIAPAVEELGDPCFRVREAAQAWLADRADRAGPMVKEALAGCTHPERKRRLAELALLDGCPPRAILKELRALEVLEAIRSADAKRLVQAVVAGMRGATLTGEAEAVLARW